MLSSPKTKTKTKFSQTQYTTSEQDSIVHCTRCSFLYNVWAKEDNV